jgi:hypothetical protein
MMFSGKNIKIKKRKEKRKEKEIGVKDTCHLWRGRISPFVYAKG